MRIFPIAAAGVFASVLALAAAAPAEAQSRRELDERLRAVESTLRTIEPRVMTGDPAAVRLLERVDDLERQIQSLTSQVEELEFENRKLRRDYDALREDMFALMDPAAGLESGQSGAAPGDGAAASAGPTSLVDDPNEDVAIVNPDDPNAEAKRAATRPLGASVADARQVRADPDFVFAQAQTRLTEGAYGQARAAYEEFVSLAPGDPRRSEAYYWIGRIQLIDEEPAAAADSFIQAMQSDGPKAPDAMVQLGVALSRLGETGEACRTLGAVSREFPGADRSILDAASRERGRIGC